MTICLVTDRRRLVPPGAMEPDARRCMLAQVRHAVDAGVDLIQVRERDLEAAALCDLVRQVCAAARGSATRIVVNDRLDIALACGAGGVHLRSDSIAVREARQLVPRGFVIGRSVHAINELEAARGADYLIAGTVFPSESKPAGHSLLGVDGLQAVARAAAAPVLAIGGITMARLEPVAATGAAGVAAIGLFVRGGTVQTGCGASALRDLVAQARLRFDSAATHP